MIEEWTDGLPRGNHLGETMRGLKPLQFVPLYQGAVYLSEKLEPWIRPWWGESLTSLSSKYWFEYKGENLLWYTPPAAAEASLELLL